MQRPQPEHDEHARADERRGPARRADLEQRRGARDAGRRVEHVDEARRRRPSRGPVTTAPRSTERTSSSVTGRPARRRARRARGRAPAPSSSGRRRPSGGADARAHRLAHRDQRRERAHHHGELVDQPVVADVQVVEALDGLVADARAEDQRVAVLALELVDVLEVLEDLRRRSRTTSASGLAAVERLEGDGRVERQSGASVAIIASRSRASRRRGRGAWPGRYSGAARRQDATCAKRPSSSIVSPSALSRPPSRRSQIRSQCSALVLLAAASRDRSGRARGGRCRRSSRRTGSRRSARSIPKFVPMPDLAEAARAVVGRQRLAQVVLADARRAPSRPRRRGTRARRRRRRRRPGDERTVKRMRPSALDSSGPVKTSPARHVARAVGVDPRAALDATGAGRCPAPRCAARARRARRSISASWKALELAPGARPGRAGRGTSRARRSRELARAPSRPARAPAEVGHSVEHQRLLQRQLAHLAARAGDAGDQLRVDARAARARRTGAWIAERRVDPLGLARAPGRRRRRAGGRARARRSPPSAPGSSTAAPARRRARGSRAAARAAAARRASSSARAPSGPARPPGSSRRAGRRTARGRGLATRLGARRVAHGASTSGNHSAQCARSASRTKRRSSGVAARRRGQQLALALGRRRRRPSQLHGQALEQELDRALPGVLAAERAPRGTLGVLRARVPGVSEPRSVSTLLAVRRSWHARCAAAPAAPRRAPRSPAHARSCPPPARAAAARRRVSGSAWPGQAAAGSSAASLRIDARACSVSWLNAACGRRGSPLQPGLRVERVEAVARQREAVGLAPQRRSCPARGPAGGRP